MKFLRPAITFLRPKFLEKIDKFLLVNYPRLWDSRIHYVLFYGLLVNISIGLIVYILFTPKLIVNSDYYNADQYNLTGLVWFIIIAEAVAFIYWFYTQSLFSIESNYGNTHYAIGLLEILIFSACSFIIFSTSLTVLAVGIKKTAYTLGISQQTICDSPSVLKLYTVDFLNSSGYNAKNIRIALEMAEEAVISGKAKEGHVWMESAVTLPEEQEVTIYREEGSITVDNRSRLLIEDGEAEVTLGDYKYPVVIKTGGVMKTVQAKELTTLKKGDEIINYIDIPVTIPAENFGEQFVYINEHTPRITLMKGSLTTRSFNEIKLEKGEALIKEEGEELVLIEGETTIEMNALKSSLLSDSAFGACLQLKYFSAKEKPDDLSNYYDVLRNSLFISWHILFMFVGIFLMIVLKHSGWLDVVYTIIYWVFQILVIALFLDIATGTDSFGLRSKLGINSTSSWFEYPKLGYSDTDLEKIWAGIFITSLVTYGLVQFMRLSKILKTKKYKRITFLRLVSFPIEAGILLVPTAILMLLIYTGPGSGPDIDLSIFSLFIFLLVLPLFALQKRMLIYLMSLPKG